jgi:hypothetical protein
LPADTPPSSPLSVSSSLRAARRRPLARLAFVAANSWSDRLRRRPARLLAQSA